MNKDDNEYGNFQAFLREPVTLEEWLREQPPRHAANEAVTDKTRPRRTVQFAIVWLGLGLPMSGLGLILSDHFQRIQWNPGWTVALLALFIGPLMLVSWLEFRRQRSGVE